MSCYPSPDDPTETLSWDALLPYCLPYVVGCPDQIVLHNIRMSTIEFCKWSGILHDVRQYDLQQKVTNYALESLCGYEILRVFRVTVNGTYDYSPVNQKLPAKTCRVGFTYYMDSPTCLNLNTPPNVDSAKGLEVETILSPKQDSCVLAKYLYQVWADGIAAGAISRILKIPNTNWFNRSESNAWSLEFRKEKVRARAEIDKAFANNGLMKAPPMVGPGGRWGNGLYSWNPNVW